MFRKLDVSRRSIVTLALSKDCREIVVRYFVNRAAGFVADGESRQQRVRSDAVDSWWRETSPTSVYRVHSHFIPSSAVNLPTGPSGHLRKTRVTFLGNPRIRSVIGLYGQVSSVGEMRRNLQISTSNVIHSLEAMPQTDILA